MRAFMVTRLQARKLPRWGLLLLCALYVLPGFIGRDPWRVDDAAGFGIALTMVRGTPIDWLIPNIAGALAIDEGGPLPFALAALLGRLFEFAWPVHVSARIAAISGLALMLVGFWYASYTVARRPGLLPPDPIGAGASRTDFARAIADSGLLVLMACLGLITRMHETTAAAAQVGWVTLFLFGAAYSLEYARRGALIVALAIAATVATRGIAPAMALLLAWLLLPIVSQPYRLVRSASFGIGAPLVIIGAGCWPVALMFATPESRDFLEHWLQWNRESLVLAPSPTSLAYLARTAPWFLWPVWPLAAWAVWRWRGKLDLPAIALPLVTIACLAVPTLFASNPDESELMLLAIPLAMLASIGLPTLKRAIVSLIDWFAVMIFTLFGVAIWAYWVAFNVGWPPKMAYRASLLAPEFTPDWIVAELVLGAIATIAWLLLVRWRISRHPPVIWRAVVLSAGGLVLAWFLLMTLWLPAFNARNTYRDIGLELGRYIPADHGCVETQGLGLAERASIYYFASPNFAPTGQDCAYRLIEDDGPVAYAEPEPIVGWALLWQGKRREHIDERFRLYHRVTPVHAR